MEKAFSGPLVIAQRMGGQLDLSKIAAMSKDEFGTVCSERPVPPIPCCHGQAHPAGLPGAERRLRRPSRENKAVTVGSDNPGPGVLEDIDVFDTIVSKLHK